MKKKSKKAKNKKRKEYESHYLALILVAVLLFEGYMFTATSPSDWQQGLGVLDVSFAVTQTAADVAFVFQPITEVVMGVDKFYQLSATEMIEILDMSAPGPIDDLSLVTEGIYDFYQEASTQMASLLDVSSVSSSWSASVAGASISVR